MNDTARLLRPARPSTAEHVVAMAIFAGATVAAAVLGSVATSAGRPWYDRLDQPWFTPPDATFGIVWTVLYVLIAVAGFLAWRADDASAPTVAWAANIALNLAWTVTFFGLRRPGWAIVVVAALWLSIAVFIGVARRRSRLAALLMVPYLLWVSFAAALNVGVAVRN